MRHTFQELLRPLIVVALALVGAGSAAAQDKPDTTAPAVTAPAPAAAAATAAPKPHATHTEQMVVVGTRNTKGRTVVTSPVAIDVLDVGAVQAKVGEVDINQMLQYVAPSFNANRQSGADGADHVDPATLRGLGPDQTLVLVNGQRLHQSSLINLFGTRGRGNTGTDLDSLPAAAIERIEILRDGAAAQYGSDAIAGVVNIILKQDTGVLAADYITGARNGHAPGSYHVVREHALDGVTNGLSANYGAGFGDGGFLNLTAQYLDRQRTNRASDPVYWNALAGGTDVFRNQFGDAAAANYGMVANLRIPISTVTNFHAFATYNLRTTDAYAWTRYPDELQRQVLSLTGGTYSPHIASVISDLNFSGGLTTDLRDWAITLDNTWGNNRFHYLTQKTINASMGDTSPTNFDDGGHTLTQNTTTLTVSRYFSDWLAGTNIAFGVENRIETYGIFAGEDASWQNYGSLNFPGTNPGALGGAQGFPGFRPSNVVDATRTNFAGYLDGEVDLTEALMLGAAVRGEHYSDFGNTVNGKIDGRFTVLDGLNLRASASTGFRAPSLAQIYYSTTYTDVVAGALVDKIIARNDSPVTRALGIPPLKQETSRNLSAGLTFSMDNLNASADAYYVGIKDRIVLTGAFPDTDPQIGAILRSLNVGAAQFFSNAVNTDTVGLDLIIGYLFALDEHKLRVSLAGNINHMTVTRPKVVAKLAGKEDIYFGARDRFFLLASAPPTKFNLSFDYGFRDFGVLLRFTEWGPVEIGNWNSDGVAPGAVDASMVDKYPMKITTDLSISYKATESLSIVVGGENIFNVYPKEFDPGLTDSGGNWDAVQMGFSGAFYFARLAVKI